MQTRRRAVFSADRSILDSCASLAVASRNLPAVSALGALVQHFEFIDLMYLAAVLISAEFLLELGGKLWFLYASVRLIS